jgi:hypothetical protein
VLHQRVRPPIIVGTDQEAAQGVHEGVVAVAAVAGVEKVLNQALQVLVTQAAVEVVSQRSGGGGVETLAATFVVSPLGVVATVGVSRPGSSWVEETACPVERAALNGR